MRSTPFAVLLILAVAGLLSTLTGECNYSWASGGPRATLAGGGFCTTLWDADGAGPGPLQLVVGGRDLVGGDHPVAQKVMAWDNSRWLALAQQPTMTWVDAMTTWNGMLVAHAYPRTVELWNGTTWQPLQLPVDVNNLQAMAPWNGLLVVGYFNGWGIHPIRAWDGATWNLLPTPPSFVSPKAMVSFQGQLCVVGNDGYGGGVLHRWNGTTWATPIMANGAIECLKVRTPAGLGAQPELFVGGSFNNIGGTSASYVAKTAGGTAFSFSSVGNLGTPCHELAVNSGTLLQVDARTSFSSMRYVSGVWSTTGNAQRGMVRYGAFTYGVRDMGPAGTACQRYDGTAWVDVRGPSLDGEVRAATPYETGMVVGGTFTATAGGPSPLVARWDGASFVPLGPGLTGTSVDALLTLGDHDVIAGGLFQSAGSLPASNIARWNGTAWASLGLGVNGPVYAVAPMPNGDLVVGGAFTMAGGIPCARIARWNGSSWAALGAGMNGEVRALCVRNDGVLFAGGAFGLAGGVACSRVAQWNASWSAVGAGCNDTVFGLAARQNGDIFAVGAFSTAGGSSADRCARWRNGAWSALGGSGYGTSPVRAVLVLPNGDAVVGHGFHTPGANDEGIARWNEAAWSGLGAGVGTLAGTPPTVAVIAQRADGELIVGGVFDRVGGMLDGTSSQSLARLDSSCLPLAVPYGAGCSSPSGPLLLEATTLPFLGAMFRTRTIGTAPGSFCISVTGFGQLALPLSQIFAAGQPGCSLLTTPDLAVVLAPGFAVTQLALSYNPALIGAQFHQQTVPLEFDGVGALVAVRGSNALTATVGTF